MQISDPERIWLAPSDQLVEGNYLRWEVEYAGEIVPVVVFRYKGHCKAYRNLCVHMPRQLDCELPTIFDSTGKYLRCSMHGIVYDPLSGLSVGTMCNGEMLTPIGIIEDQQGIWIQDIRVKSCNAQDIAIGVPKDFGSGIRQQVPSVDLIQKQQGDCNHD